MPKKPQYWQIGCGSSARDYADDFIRYGMALVGGDKKVATMTKVAPGDRVILRRGGHGACAQKE